MSLPRLFNCKNFSPTLGAFRLFIDAGSPNARKLTLSTLGKIFSRHFEIFLFSLANRIEHFVHIVSNGGNLYDMSNPVFFFVFLFFVVFFRGWGGGGGGRGIRKLSSELTQRVVKVNPFMPSGFFYFKSLDRFIFYIRGVWLVFIIVML